MFVPLTPQPLCGSANVAAFRFQDAAERRSPGGRATAAHFHDRNQVSSAGNHVDLVPTDPQVHGYDVKTLFPEVPDDGTFSATTNGFGVFQRWAPHRSPSVVLRYGLRKN